MPGRIRPSAPNGRAQRQGPTGEPNGRTQRQGPTAGGGERNPPRTASRAEARRTVIPIPSAAHNKSSDTAQGQDCQVSNCYNPGIAQLAERVLSMHEVPDSISGFSTHFFFLFGGMLMLKAASFLSFCSVAITSSTLPACFLLPNPERIWCS